MKTRDYVFIVFFEKLLTFIIKKKNWIKPKITKSNAASPYRNKVSTLVNRSFFCAVPELHKRLRLLWPHTASSHCFHQTQSFSGFIKIHRRCQNSMEPCPVSLEPPLFCFKLNVVSRPATIITTWNVNTNISNKSRVRPLRKRTSCDLLHETNAVIKRRFTRQDAQRSPLEHEGLLSRAPPTWPFWQFPKLHTPRRWAVLITSLESSGQRDNELIEGRNESQKLSIFASVLLTLFFSSSSFF